MPEYKLVYLTLRGRAEPIRWILAVTDQPYDDVRYIRETEWPFKKPEMPYGHVPVLFVDGKPLCQSVSICRYLGRMHGLFVDDPWEAALGDEVADAVNDLIQPAGQIAYARLANETEKYKMLATEFHTTTLPPTIRELDRRLDGRDWFCGSKMTWVDLFAACYLKEITLQHEGSLDAVPRLKKHVEKIAKLPQIEKWLKERPDSML
ncbi:hematopoietic prostaglandin D synthase-like [Portunus trituberculatus]|uniref:hematopoietic prostaglandin D synthase-like n=1 Tax=Portunus trituberculatus TaxID=210409 RepID=UPI001E1CB046|nr:hematopoietic prostaglandin D synthase-like [Portunus trituberculatus]XP_045112984.1 hematopoietic prostaglandin D synthase-like [Portunus trituberculatus]